jgi:hypothetical protein
MTTALIFHIEMGAFVIRIKNADLDHTVSTAVAPLLDAYNATAGDLRPAVANLFGVPELLVLQQAASAGQ